MAIINAQLSYLSCFLTISHQTLSTCRSQAFIPWCVCVLAREGVCVRVCVCVDVYAGN